MSFNFKNDLERELLEVEFIQPLDPNAALSGMKVVVGDRCIEAQIREYRDAKKMYVNTRNGGHGAYLGTRDLEQSDVFGLSVGNILPGQVIVVTVSYLTELQLVDNCSGNSALRLSVPRDMVTQ